MASYLDQKEVQQQLHHVFQAAASCLKSPMRLPVGVQDVVGPLHVKEIAREMLLMWRELREDWKQVSDFFETFLLCFNASNLLPPRLPAPRFLDPSHVLYSP